MRHSPLGKFTLATLILGLGTVGCEMGGDKSAAGTAQEKGGKVIDRSQGQTVNPDGSAVRTRTQMRQAPSGATVRETQTEKREVVDSPGGGSNADPTKADPGSAE